MIEITVYLDLSREMFQGDGIGYELRDNGTLIIRRPDRDVIGGQRVVAYFKPDTWNWFEISEVHTEGEKASD